MKMIFNHLSRGFVRMLLLSILIMWNSTIHAKTYKLKTTHHVGNVTVTHKQKTTKHTHKKSYKSAKITLFEHYFRLHNT